MTNANPKVVALALLALAGCGGDGITGKTEKPDRTPAISGAALNAGGEGVLTGTALDLLPATLTVDGLTVTPSTRSATEIRFAMPAGRPCEVDGRPIAIQAGTLTHTAALEVPSTIAMEVGESRVLTREQLATLCLQLPAGRESYVFTALNPALTRGGPDPLFTVRTWSGSGAASATVNPAQVRAPAHRGYHHSAHPATQSLRSSGVWHSYSPNPTPFDPRYTTATIGDTVPWADLHNVNVRCDSPREQVPTFPVVVAGISSTGKTVLAFDARSTQGAKWLSPAVRQRLNRTANIMERWAVPAVRAVMDPAYEPVRGAGGRWWHVFRTNIDGYGVDTRMSVPQTMCRYSSEMTTTHSGDLPPEYDGEVEYLASIFIHEYAHHAEDVHAVRRWGTTFVPGTATWALTEPWAQTVAETAARLASNQPTDARYSALGADVPLPDFYLNGYGEHPAQSQFGDTPVGRSGAYDQSVRLLMYLRERWGDAAANTTHERFFGRVKGLPLRSLDAMAGLVGLSANDALDQWALAEATDNLVDPAVASARGLPQIRSWAPQDSGPLPSMTLSRLTGGARVLNVGHGNYAALYALSEGDNSGKGLSLTFEGFGSAPFIARITRLN